mmetsp:Transcript_33968/g.97857  ORF Transcript_33968/g.97857 Transcript_33968/m.97857 type:complete len:256 (-) Transcript_33968:108-875(-)
MLRKRLESRSKNMRPSRSRGACARPVRSLSRRLPGCCTIVCRAASKITPPTLMSTMVSVAMLCSEMRSLSFSWASNSARNFSLSSMKRLRPCKMSPWIESLSSCSLTRASCRSCWIWRLAASASICALLLLSRILSYSACFWETNSCQTRAFSSSNAWRSFSKPVDSSCNDLSAFSTQWRKFLRTSPIIVPNSSCEANRIGGRLSKEGPGASALLGPGPARPPPAPTEAPVPGAATGRGPPPKAPLDGKAALPPR